MRFVIVITGFLRTSDHKFHGCASLPFRAEPNTKVRYYNEMFQPIPIFFLTMDIYLLYSILELVDHFFSHFLASSLEVF
jgi:hypothetical protein